MPAALDIRPLAAGDQRAWAPLWGTAGAVCATTRLPDGRALSAPTDFLPYNRS